MMKIALTFVSLVFLVACSGNKAAGTYVLDKESMLKGMIAQLPDAMKEQMKKSFDGMSMEAKLNSDGTCSMQREVPNPLGGPVKTRSGTYKVDGDKLTVTILERDGKKEEKPEEKTATLKDGVITMSEKGMELRLVKK